MCLTTIGVCKCTLVSPSALASAEVMMEAHYSQLKDVWMTLVLLYLARIQAYAHAARTTAFS